MLKIPWTDRVTNEEVLRRAGVDRKLIVEIRTRKDGLENLEGKEG